MGDTPYTTEEWVEASRTIFVDVVALLGKYGVSPSPELRIVAGDAPTPYYEEATSTIGIGMPDPATLQGRMFWIVGSRLLQMETVDETIAAMADELPVLVAHEVIHHLRHEYSAPTESDFVEEQVADLLAIRIVLDLPRYAHTIEALRDHVTRTTRSLPALTPDTAPHLAGFRLELTDVLAAQGAADRTELEGLEALARATGVEIDDVLRHASEISDEELTRAETTRTETEAYFNRRYMANLFEYTLFHHEFFRACLELPEIEPLGTLLERHILTDDWERTRREENLLLLRTTAAGPDPDLAAAARELLAEEAPTAPEAAQGAHAGPREAVGGDPDEARDRFLERLAHAGSLRRARPPAPATDLERLYDEALQEEHDRLLADALAIGGRLGAPEAMAVSLRGRASTDPVARAAADQLALDALPQDLRALYLCADNGNGARRAAGAPPLLEDPLLHELTDALRRIEPLATASYPTTQETTVLTTVDKLLHLRAVPLFREVTVRQLRDLTEEIVTEHYLAGTAIFSVGDPGTAMYLVTQGRIGIDQETDGDGVQRIAEVVSRQTFGETALFHDEPRSATAVAIEDSTLLRLERDTIFRLGESEPGVLIAVVRELSRRLREANADLG